ncbi:MAG: hypothetical protein VXY81_14865, partial [Pseudomonadota bacterium]|nr:hypothetical protein [Pseudomonadota bacterium]
QFPHPSLFKRRRTLSYIYVHALGLGNENGVVAVNERLGGQVSYLANSGFTQRRLHVLMGELPLRLGAPALAAGHLRLLVRRALRPLVRQLAPRRRVARHVRWRMSGPSLKGP